MKRQHHDDITWNFKAFAAVEICQPREKRISIGQLRVKITKALSKAWKEMIQHLKIMCFWKPGLTLPLDGSLDSKKMHFEGCDAGIPPGMVICPADSEEPEEGMLMAGWINFKLQIKSCFVRLLTNQNFWNCWLPANNSFQCLQICMPPFRCVWSQSVF